MEHKSLGERIANGSKYSCSCGLILKTEQEMDAHTQYAQLANDIMENYPEYSFCLTCTRWNYEKHTYDFFDEETGKTHTVTEDQVSLALPKLRQLMKDGKLHFEGMNALTSSSWTDVIGTRYPLTPLSNWCCSMKSFTDRK